MKQRHYEVISPAGNRIVLIDQKIKLSTKFKLACHRLSEWFESGTVDEHITMWMLALTFVSLYWVAASI